MSFEARVLECIKCGDRDGPFVTVSTPSFSASGARPDAVFEYCEPCDRQMRQTAASVRRPSRMLGRFTDGH